MTAKRNFEDLEQQNQRAVILQACDLCRKKKIKCDGKKPCMNCSSRELDCTYNVPVKRRGPIKKKGGITTAGRKKSYSNGPGTPQSDLRRVPSTSPGQSPQQVLQRRILQPSPLTSSLRLDHLSSPYQPSLLGFPYALQGTPLFQQSPALYPFAQFPQNINQMNQIRSTKESRPSVVAQQPAPQQSSSGKRKKKKLFSHKGKVKPNQQNSELQNKSKQQDQLIQTNNIENQLNYERNQDSEPDQFQSQPYALGDFSFEVRVPFVRVGPHRLLYLEVYRRFLNPYIGLHGDDLSLFAAFPFETSRVVLAVKWQQAYVRSVMQSRKIQNSNENMGKTLDENIISAQASRTATQALRSTHLSKLEHMTLHYLDALHMQFFAIVATGARILNHQLTANICIRQARYYAAVLHDVTGSLVNSTDLMPKRLTKYLSTLQQAITTIRERYEKNDDDEDSNSNGTKSPKLPPQNTSTTSIFFNSISQFPKFLLGPGVSAYIQSLIINACVAEALHQPPSVIMEGAFVLEYIRGLLLISNYFVLLNSRRTSQLLGIVHELYCSSYVQELLYSPHSPFHTLIAHPKKIPEFPRATVLEQMLVNLHTHLIDNEKDKQENDVGEKKKEMDKNVDIIEKPLERNQIKDEKEIINFNENLGKLVDELLSQILNIHNNPKIKEKISQDKDKSKIMTKKSKKQIKDTPLGIFLLIVRELQKFRCNVCIFDQGSPPIFLPSIPFQLNKSSEESIIQNTADSIIAERIFCQMLEQAHRALLHDFAGIYKVCMKNLLNEEEKRNEEITSESEKDVIDVE
ncbi:MAG: hypothetical protein EZS28_018063, partial [Streblomastix strix]